MSRSGPPGDVPVNKGVQDGSSAERQALRARFGPERRLHSPREFREAQAGAVRVQTEPFVLLLNRRRDITGPSRLGLVASRKVGNAARRNRLRRLLREAFRKGVLRVPDGTDVVVIFRAHLPAMSFGDVEGVLRGAQARLKKALDRLEKSALATTQEQERSP